MRNVIASARIKQSPEINVTPVLSCEGRCVDAKPHELSHLELRYEYHPQDPPALNMMYRCDTCGRLRRWGCITWKAALLMDPDLTTSVLGLSEG